MFTCDSQSHYLLLESRILYEALDILSNVYILYEEKKEKEKCQSDLCLFESPWGLELFSCKACKTPLSSEICLQRINMQKHRQHVS